MIMQLTTPDMCKLLKINRNSIQNWLDRKYIKASIHTASRNGDTNIFNYIDLLAIKIFMIEKKYRRRKYAAKIAQTVYELHDYINFNEKIYNFFIHSKKSNINLYIERIENRFDVFLMNRMSKNLKLNSECNYVIIFNIDRVLSMIK